LDDSFVRRKKWLLNERKSQQQEDDKLKRSSNSNNTKDTAKFSGKDNTNSRSDSNIPNQYANVKNVVKGEDDIQDQTAIRNDFIDEFLEDANKVLIYRKNTIPIMKCGILTIICIQVLALTLPYKINILTSFSYQKSII
jgi:hypothetical protein